MREMFYVLLGYLSGSILFARIVPQMLCHVDVTRAGEDRNPGTFNAFVAAGPLVGTVVLLLELGKGFLPVHLALNHLQPEDPAFSLILLAPVVGHAWPLLHVKEGGKAIAVSFGVLLGMYPFLKPALLLTALYLLFSLVLVVRPNLYRSVLTFLCFAVGMSADGHVSGVAAGLSGDLRGRLLASYPDGREGTGDIYFSAGV